MKVQIFVKDGKIYGSVNTYSNHSFSPS